LRPKRNYVIDMKGGRVKRMLNAEGQERGRGQKCGWKEGGRKEFFVGYEDSLIKI